MPHTVTDTVDQYHWKYLQLWQAAVISNCCLLASGALGLGNGERSLLPRSSSSTGLFPSFPLIPGCLALYQILPPPHGPCRASRYCTIYAPFQNIQLWLISHSRGYPSWRADITLAIDLWQMVLQSSTGQGSFWAAHHWVRITKGRRR